MREIIILPHFERVLKPLLKKYVDLYDSVIESLKSFRPESSIKVAYNIYKIRLSTKSVRRGKSGGFRLYILITEVENNLVPITVYFKGDKSNLTPRELKQHIEIILSELQQL